MDFKLEVDLFSLPPLNPDFAGKAVKAPNAIHFLLFQIFLPPNFSLLTCFALRNVPFWNVEYPQTASTVHISCNGATISDP